MINKVRIKTKVKAKIKAKTKHRRSMAFVSSKQQGFTLIELLVVVSILAALAGITSVAMDGYQQDAEAKITRVEMQRISNAIRRFKADTGYWPKTGPFSYDSDHTEVSDTWPSSFNMERYRDNYFNDKANLWWLFEQPTKYIGQWKTGTLSNLVRDPNNGSTETIWEWDIDTAFGWHGPYIDSPSIRQVIKDEVAQDGCSTMNTATVTASAIRPHSSYPTTIVKRIQGLVDRFQQVRERNTGGEYCVIQRDEANPDNFKVSEFSGSPYLYEAKFTHTNSALCTKNADTDLSVTCAALRSFGPDGEDNGGADTSDDIVFVLQVNSELGE